MADLTEAQNAQALPAQPEAQPDHRSLPDLTIAARLAYEQKHYDTAADLYTTAVEKQAEQNGEMAPENAELLYLYGRCLYKVAVSKSDVLGGKVAGEEAKERKSKVKAESSASGGKGAKGVLEKKAEEAEKEAVENKPFFEFQGDENWDDSDDEGEDAEGADGANGDAEEEEDDFANAFETLDFARLLLSKQLQAIESDIDDTDKATRIRTVKERLADTHDLQAEISLENEQFQNAVSDCKAALEYVLDLYPAANSRVAEAHFKLSLALEFASVTSQPAPAPPNGNPASTIIAEDTQTVDTAVRAEAAEQMSKALESCKLRLASEKQSLAELKDLSEEEQKKKREEIKDVEEIIQDMTQRLAELKEDLESPELKEVLGGLAGKGSSSGGAAHEKTAQATDLSGLVKKKTKPAEAGAEVKVEGNGKRKADDEGVEVANGSNGKKAKIEDA